ncbi:programmed cell death protein 2 [Cucurbita moschata]|uniref:Programmed cell death protein 2 n=1 Tax=Cucurbita moschata TaxID=3662 RepID=A0A6J1HBV3_CUCMO|nr:programmed cell death protein 2 [Cucurbita moschata]XP_022961336.1 programmed cell death protein 2 [Cucurbita moschata]
MDEIGNGAVESMEKLNSLRITSLDDEDINDDEELLDDSDTDDDDEDEESDESVVLGFVEKPENSWSLLPQLFPSKAGGVPAWLDPVNLPSGRSCVCDICGEPLQFLLQIYAPIVEKDSTFHRTLFVFMCPSMTCLLRDQHEQWKSKSEKSSRSVKVFRGQLPRSNPFYSSEAPKHDGTDKPCASGVAPCSWCGTWKGDKVCSKCRKVRYCSEQHQAIHWRTGHKTDCQRMCISSQLSSSGQIYSQYETDTEKVSKKHLWPEFGIIHEYESEFNMETSQDDSHANALVRRDRMDDSMKSLLANFEGDDDRKSWASFQVRLSKAPEQVLRYCRDDGSKPLWPMSSGRPSKADIPKCSYCSGPMCYEFQILPQLLYYFGVKNDVDSLDWATIVVYTCEASCESSIAYKEEFAWVQLSTPSSVPQ